MAVYLQEFYVAYISIQKGGIFRGKHYKLQSHVGSSEEQSGIFQ